MAKKKGSSRTKQSVAAGKHDVPDPSGMTIREIEALLASGTLAKAVLRQLLAAERDQKNRNGATAAIEAALAAGTSGAPQPAAVGEKAAHTEDDQPAVAGSAARGNDGDERLSAGKDHVAQGRYAAAAACYRDALTIFQEKKDLTGVVRSTEQLAIVSLLQADYEQAERRYEEALSVLKQLDDTDGQAELRCQLDLLGQMKAAAVMLSG